MDEIRDWLLTDGARRQAIIDDLPQRRAHEDALREAAKQRQIAG